MKTLLAASCAAVLLATMAAARMGETPAQCNERYAWTPPKVVVRAGIPTPRPSTGPVGSRV